MDSPAPLSLTKPISKAEINDMGFRTYIRPSGRKIKTRGKDFFGVSCADLKEIDAACDRLMAKYDWVQPDVEKTSPKRRRVQV